MKTELPQRTQRITENFILLYSVALCPPSGISKGHASVVNKHAI